MTPEPINTRTTPDEKDTVAMNDNDNDNNPATSGALDDFLNANGPLSVTIKAEYPSPDKTTSEMVSEQSISPGVHWTYNTIVTESIDFLSRFSLSLKYSRV